MKSFTFSGARGAGVVGGRTTAAPLATPLKPLLPVWLFLLIGLPWAVPEAGLSVGGAIRFRLDDFFVVVLALFSATAIAARRFTRTEASILRAFAFYFLWYLLLGLGRLILGLETVVYEVFLLLGSGVLFFMIMVHASNESRLKAILAGMALGGAALSGRILSEAAWVTLSGQSPLYYGAWKRILAIEGWQSNFAAEVAIFCCWASMCWYALERERTRWRYVALICSGVCTLAPFVVLARGAMIVMTVFWATVLLTTRDWRFMLLAVVGAAGAIVVEKRLTDILEKALAQFTYAQSVYLTTWRQGLAVFCANPIIGVGTGGSRFASALYEGIERVPHNFYIFLLASGGLAGGLLFAWLCCCYAPAIWQLFKMPRYRLLARLGISLGTAMTIFGVYQPLVGWTKPAMAALAALACLAGVAQKELSLTRHSWMVPRAKPRTTLHA